MALVGAAAATAASEGRRVVVVGAGIIGASVAHFLAKRGLTPLVVEQCGVACHSSGKAAGFLALDWNDSSPVGKLARRSFHLHQQLAEEFGAASIGYRRMRCIGCSSGSTGLRGGGLGMAWLDRTDGRMRAMGTHDTIAQVHPRKLTEALMESAALRGGSLMIDRVTGVGLATGREGESTVAEVICEQAGPLRCDAVVLAMGAWTQAAHRWFPGAGLPTSTASHKYTSVTWDASADDTAVFLDSAHDVQIYPRPDEVYACGFPEVALPLPDDPGDIAPCPLRAEGVRAEAARYSTALQSAPVSSREACYLPGGSGDGLPIIGRIPSVANGFVACSHTCWGILNAPATGEALAALVDGGPSDGAADLSPFQPGRGGLLARAMAALR